MQQSQVSTVLCEQSQLESTTTQIMDLILDLLVIKRNKYNDRKQNRPRMIMSDKTILKYLQKRLFIADDQVFFTGEAYFEPQTWKTESYEQKKKIAQYVIDKNTVRWYNRFWGTSYD